MSSFNFIGMPGAGAAASDYSYLTSQLDIKQNQLLSVDGKLSPGDYDLLIGMARSAYAHPGLTASDRNNIAVKLSGYEKDKSTSALADKTDLTKLNAGVSDDVRTATMLRGNDPAGFIQANADVLSAKLSQLKDSIDAADSAGNDSSVLTNEYSATLAQYNDMTNALSDTKAYAANPTGVPNTDYAAFLTTNSKGEITDVQIGRQGSITGYTEVKALYGGLPIYGKLNEKSQGNDVFKLGNKTYTAPSFYYDPNNPNAKAILVDQSQQQGNYSNAANTPYVDMDTKTTAPQGYIPDNGWAQGSSPSTFYHNDGGGKYTKYVNASQKGLNIPNGGYIALPTSIESSIAPAVGTTTDMSAPMVAPVPAAMAPSTAITSTPAVAGPAPTPVAPLPTSPLAMSRTQAPVFRAPQSTPGIASSAVGAATNFLGSVFNKPGQ